MPAAHLARGPIAPLARRVVVAGALLIGGSSLVAGASPLGGCAAKATADPDYVRVNLVPTATAAGTPRAAMIEVRGRGALLTTLCVNLAGTAGQTAATFVLSRDAQSDPTIPVTLVVHAFDALSTLTGTQPGEEVTCPSTLPAPLVPPQMLSLDFCRSQTMDLVLNVGAACCAPADAGLADAGTTGGCGCAAGQVCGLGLSTSGDACAPDECCNDFAESCKLEPVRR